MHRADLVASCQNNRLLISASCLEIEAFPFDVAADPPEARNHLSRDGGPYASIPRGFITLQIEVLKKKKKNRDRGKRRINFNTSDPWSPGAAHIPPHAAGPRGAARCADGAALRGNTSFVILRLIK